MIESDGWETVYCSPPVEQRIREPHVETFDDNGRSICSTCFRLGPGNHGWMVGMRRNIARRILDALYAFFEEFHRKG